MFCVGYSLDQPLSCEEFVKDGPLPRVNKTQVAVLYQHQLPPYHQFRHCHWILLDHLNIDSVISSRFPETRSPESRLPETRSPEIRFPETCSPEIS